MERFARASARFYTYDRKVRNRRCEMNVASLQEYGCTYVPYPAELRTAVEQALESWKAFCALPDEQKLLFGYDPDVKTSGNGYELKNIAKGDIDSKEDMHLRVIAREELLRRARLVDGVVAPRFVEDALAINPYIASVVSEFGRTVEQEYGVVGFEKDILATQPSWLIRFLHYFGDRRVDDEIATAHVDKGGFTLHLIETDGGVERLAYHGRSWVPLPLPAGKTVILPGMGLQNRSRGQLRALCHRVVATSDTAKHGRYSAVCFFNFDNMRFYNKTAYGSLQKWPPGAFYDMPFEEFNKLFVD